MMSASSGLLATTPTLYQREPRDQLRITDRSTVRCTITMYCFRLRNIKVKMPLSMYQRLNFVSKIYLLKQLGVYSGAHFGISYVYTPLIISLRTTSLDIFHCLLH